MIVLSFFSGRGITPCDESTELKVINNHHDQNCHSTVIFDNTQTGIHI